jgi:hypothetical protein
MPMWRCPHCGTPQAETARCWVCRRSSTACATCRYFRGSVAAQLGYCGLDRQRLPLHGDEIRACWETAAVPSEAVATGGAGGHPRADDPDMDRTPVPKLDFIEVRSTPVKPSRRSTPTVAAGAATAAALNGGDETPVAIGAVEPGWSLWGDAEP